jgi:histone acetyltransferase (RNA polymerase elongator complex component)
MMVSKNANSSDIRDPNQKSHHAETADRRPETRNQRPGASDQNPEARDQKPETRHRPFVIPIFLPHAGCPHRCIFCDQKSITGAHKPSFTAEDIRERVAEFLGYKHKPQQPVQIAFYGGNFLGQAFEKVKKLLAAATDLIEQGRADSIRFSTRPDTIARHSMAIIDAFPVSTIELGVQSMHDDVLAASRRGHTRADTIEAVKLLKERDYEIGLQIMVGLPGDDEEKCLQTGHSIIDLRPDFVRIYPTVVLENSSLARQYRHGTYVPMPLEKAVRQVADLLVLFKNSGIKTIRMGLQSSEDLDSQSTIVAGPYHPAFGHLVYSKLFLDNAILTIRSKGLKGGRAAIRVHPKNISRMRGQKNENIETLKRKFHFNAIDIIPDATVAADNLMEIDRVKPG